MSNKGNILLVANWESNVGYAWWLMEGFWVEISKYFEAEDISSHLIYPKITQLPETVSNSNIIVHECDFQSRSLNNMRKLYQLIKNHNIRFVYLSDSPAYGVFYILLRFFGVKKIVVHDHTPGERTRAKSWRKFLKSLVQRIPFYTADHFIAVTEYVYKRFIEVSCIPEKKCSVVSNGIEPIELNKADFKYAHKIFSIPEDRTIIVTTGRASYYKGIDFFIKCADELINKQGMLQLHFLFCGDGPDMMSFQDLVKQLGLESHFTFTGKRTDIRSILPSCQLGFHAATGEVGYSLSILEYMSAGLITIAPDNPSVSLATKHMKNGILYRSRNLESATKAIKTAVSSELAETIRKNAIQTVRDKYTIKNTNQQLIDVLIPIFS